MKGIKFERGICSMLSRWQGSSETKQESLPFRRRSTAIVPLDGLWTGDGDILVKPGIYWPFSTEAKNIEGWTFDKLFSEEGTPYRWWDQAQEQAERSGKIPLLLFSRNLAPVYFMLEELVWQRLLKENALRTGTGNIFLSGSPKNVVVGLAADLMRKVRFSSLQSLQK